MVGTDSTVTRTAVKNKPLIFTTQNQGYNYFRCIYGGGSSEVTILNII